MSARILIGVTVKSFPFDDNGQILEFPSGSPVSKTKKKPRGRERDIAPEQPGRIGWLVVNYQFRQVWWAGHTWRLVFKRQYLHMRFPGLNGGGD